MKIVPDSPIGLRAVLETLVRLPEDVRAFACSDMAFLTHGVRSHGYVVRPGVIDSARAVVVLDETCPDPHATIAHEVAHAFRSGFGGTDKEREAAALASEWGFRGPAADPLAAVANYRPWTRPQIDLRTGADPNERWCWCASCGESVELIAPTVPGLHAIVGGGCRCGLDLLKLVLVARCDVCGDRPDAVWARDAAPDRLLVHACPCATSPVVHVRSEWRAHCDPPPPLPTEDIDYVSWASAAAAAHVEDMCDALRRPEPTNAMARELERRPLFTADFALTKAIGGAEPGDPRRWELVIVQGDLRAARAALHDRERAAELVERAHERLSKIVD